MADVSFSAIKAMLGPAAGLASSVYYVFIYPLVNPSSRLFVLYVAVYLVLAVWALRLHGMIRPGATWQETASAVFPRQVFWHPSARQDYWYFAASGLVNLLVLSAVQWVSVPAVSHTLADWLASAAPTRPAEFGTGAAIALTVLLFIAYDLGTYIGHMLQHRVPWLWEFHKVHHSAEVLTPITNYREHFLDVFIIAEVGSLLAGLVGGIFQYLYGDSVGPYTVMGVLFLSWAFYLTANFRHSHVWISYGYRLNHVFSSPAMHQLHHSSEPRHWDRNYGLALSVWDVMFRTAYIPRGREEFRLGLSDRTEADYASTWAKFLMPFWRCIAPKRRQAQGSESP